MSQEPPTHDPPGADTPTDATEAGPEGVGDAASASSSGSVPIEGDRTGDDTGTDEVVPGEVVPAEVVPAEEEVVTGDPVSAEAETGQASPVSSRRRARRWNIEWVVNILVAVGLAFGVRTFVAQTYFVPSTS
ncbi:MAG: hypothetical protein ACRDXC_04780, partial [Acidimicrobiales bacterium]